MRCLNRKMLNTGKKNPMNHIFIYLRVFFFENLLLISYSMLPLPLKAHELSEGENEWQNVRWANGCSVHSSSIQIQICDYKCYNPSWEYLKFVPFYGITASRFLLCFALKQVAQLHIYLCMLTLNLSLWIHLTPPFFFFTKFANNSNANKHDRNALAKNDSHLFRVLHPLKALSAYFTTLTDEKRFPNKHH